MAITFTFDELTRLQGVGPRLFNLQRKEDWEALVAEHIPIVSSRVRRAIGTTTYNTTDEDKQQSVKQAVMYATTVAIMSAALNQKVFGTGPPLLTAPPQVIEARIQAIADMAQQAADDAQLDEATDQSPLLGEALFTGSSTEPYFTREQQW